MAGMARQIIALAEQPRKTSKVAAGIVDQRMNPDRIVVVVVETVEEGLV
jgi:hypothetical protein